MYSTCVSSAFKTCNFNFVIDGKIELNGNIMKTRDAARIENEKNLSIEAVIPTELLLIDPS